MGRTVSIEKINKVKGLLKKRFPDRYISELCGVIFF